MALDFAEDKELEGKKGKQSWQSIKKGTKLRKQEKAYFLQVFLK